MNAEFKKVGPIVQNSTTLPVWRHKDEIWENLGKPLYQGDISIPNRGFIHKYYRSMPEVLFNQYKH